MVTVLDCECFWINGKMVIKEIAIMRNMFQFHHAIFPPPCRWNQLSRKDEKTNSYIKNHRLCIDWNHSSSSETTVQFLNRTATKVILVRGRGKTQLIQEMLPNNIIINCESFSSTPLPSSSHSCPLHHQLTQHHYCALSKCFQIYSSLFGF
jgi:hypothetical protein